VAKWIGSVAVTNESTAWSFKAKMLAGIRGEFLIELILASSLTMKAALDERTGKGQCSREDVDGSVLKVSP
jgi:hypothetical protein